jgi:hypothetical protein
MAESPWLLDGRSGRRGAALPNPALRHPPPAARYRTGARALRLYIYSLRDPRAPGSSSFAWLRSRVSSLSLAPPPLRRTARARMYRTNGDDSPVDCSAPDSGGREGGKERPKEGAER